MEQTCEVDEKIIPVGLKIKDFRATLRYLRDYYHTPISELPTEAASKHRELVKYVSHFYRSSAYDTLYDEIQKVFSGYGEATPGTVGGFCIGCSLQTNFSDIPSCSLLASTAIPPPASKNWEICPYLIVRVKRDTDDTYLFSVENAAHMGSRDMAYLYVTCSSMKEFIGLSKEEKRQLSEFGIYKVKIIQADRSGVQYKNLTDEFINLEDVPTRNGRLPIVEGEVLGISPTIDSHTDNGNMNLFWILLGFIIVLLFIVALKR